MPNSETRVDARTRSCSALSLSSRNERTAEERLEGRGSVWMEFMGEEGNSIVGRGYFRVFSFS